MWRMCACVCACCVVCVYVWSVCACTWACLFSCSFSCVCACMPVHSYICVHKLCVCMHMSMFVFMFICMFLHLCLLPCVCVCACMRVGVWLAVILASVSNRTVLIVDQMRNIQCYPWEQKVQNKQCSREEECCREGGESKEGWNKKQDEELFRFREQGHSWQKFQIWAVLWFPVPHQECQTTSGVCVCLHVCVCVCVRVCASMHVCDLHIIYIYTCILASRYI